MMFRERRGKHSTMILCISTTYDPNKKRGVQKVEASFSPYADKIPDEELQKLSEDDRKAAVKWLADFKAKLDQTGALFAGNRVTERANELSDALEDPERQEAALRGLDHVALYKAIDRLMKTLKKHKRTRPAAEKTSESQPAAAAGTDALTDAENLSA